MQIDIFEMLKGVKPYMVWFFFVFGAFLIVLMTTTEFSRSFLQRKAKKFFPLAEEPLTEVQIKLLMKKIDTDLMILKKDLNEWKRLGKEEQITRCELLITNLEDMLFLTRYKLLTTEQIYRINQYMLENEPVWKRTNVKY